ncbi:unnamed protein product [Linum tenue]|uniref:linamarin synthase n=1 Tax=Linum tenue TaxID=586396 RepID=A0AAV0MDU0_9ROSI|nr:unnamed protein product [Linum tenue]
MSPPAATAAGCQTRHAVCIPYPAQGHINPMLQLAKLLYSHGGFHITFVNTEYNHRRLLKSRGGAAAFFDSLPPGFNFQAIPDGLPPPPTTDATQDIALLSDSTSKTCLAPFRDLVLKLNDAASSSSPAVSCIVSDGAMTFTLEVAKELGIPEALFWTPSACGVLAYANYHLLVQRGFFPLKDSSYLTNGYLETPVDFIPGMSNNIRLKDLPSFLRTTNANDIMFNFVQREISKLPEATAFLINTFEPLEKDVLAALSQLSPNLLTIGPLNLLLRQVVVGGDKLRNVSTNLWTEHPECVEWLDSQQPNSVLYVNFGSITVLNPDQLKEFAWGLASSEISFLWVVRPDLVSGESAALPPEFVDETKGRGLLVGWCSQERVLDHPAIGGFLSHMGWNSTMESLSHGVPMICWPFFAEQQTNCFYACNEWGVGMEIDPNVKRDQVEELVREVMGGGKGKEMKRRAVEWKNKAIESTVPGGSSYQNVERLIHLLS